MPHPATACRKQGNHGWVRIQQVGLAWQLMRQQKRQTSIAGCRTWRMGGSVNNTGVQNGLSCHVFDPVPGTCAMDILTKTLTSQLLSGATSGNRVTARSVWTALDPVDKQPRDIAAFGQDSDKRCSAQHDLWPMSLWPRGYVPATSMGLLVIAGAHDRTRDCVVAADAAAAAIAHAIVQTGRCGGAISR